MSDQEARRGMPSSELWAGKALEDQKREEDADKRRREDMELAHEMLNGAIALFDRANAMVARVAVVAQQAPPAGLVSPPAMSPSALVDDAMVRSALVESRNLRADDERLRTQNDGYRGLMQHVTTRLREIALSGASREQMLMDLGALMVKAAEEPES